MQSPNTVVVERLNSNEDFQNLTLPISDDHFPEIRDAQLYVRNDGLIVNAEGWYHPEGKLIGEVMYAPDVGGDRNIFGQTYRKLTLRPGTYTPVPYAERAALLKGYDPRFGSNQDNPYFARYKQMFDRSEFVSYIPNEYTFDKLKDLLAWQYPEVLEDICGIGETIGLDMTGISIGFTGAPSFGKLDALHDLDIVFSADLDTNYSIADAMRNMLRENPARRLTEGGKGWNIRYLNDRGTLICCFFTYQNPNLAPLRKFAMDVVAPEVTVEAIVAEDIHGIYTPTVLEVTDSQLVSGEDRIKIETQDRLFQIIAYHTASRGESFKGDKITSTGALVRITTEDGSKMGVCITEREGLRNMTPTWNNYYQ